MEKLPISFTQINTFNICPIRYTIKYVFHKQEPRNPFLVAGQMLHNAIVTMRDIGFQETLKCYVENYDYWWEKVDIKTITEKEFIDLFSSMLEEVAATATYYFDSEVWLEREFQREYKGETLIGRVDYLSKNLLIDFKFNKNFNYLKPEQLDFYRYLSDFDGKTAFLVWTWKKENKLIPFEKSVNIEDYIDDFLERKDKDRTPNLESCKFCPFVTICQTTKEEGYDEIEDVP